MSRATHTPWMEGAGHDRCGPVGQGFWLPFCIRRVRAWHLREALYAKIRLAEEPGSKWADQWRNRIVECREIATRFKEKWQAGWSYHDPIEHMSEVSRPMVDWLTPRELVDLHRWNEDRIRLEVAEKSCQRCKNFKREFGGPCRCDAEVIEMNHLSSRA